MLLLYLSLLRLRFRQSRRQRRHQMAQFDLTQRIIKQLSVQYCRASSEGPSFATEESMGKLVLGVVILTLSAGAASAQYVSPGYGYGYGYGAPAYGYAATAPLYNYAAPGYGYAAPAVAPAQGATTIIIVTPAPAYTAPQVYAAPPVATGYYAAAASQPLYNYAPGYGYGYTPGYWNRGYWGRYYGW